MTRETAERIAKETIKNAIDAGAIVPEFVYLLTNDITNALIKAAGKGPSEQEIWKEARKYTNETVEYVEDNSTHDGFIAGAKWCREKIQGNE